MQLAGSHWWAGHGMRDAQRPGLELWKLRTPGRHATHLAAGKLVGDALLAAAFVSYAGPFNMQFRKRLVTEKWLPDLIERVIPMTTGVMPLDMLASDSSKVQPSCLPS